MLDLPRNFFGGFERSPAEGCTTHRSSIRLSKEQASSLEIFRAFLIRVWLVLERCFYNDTRKLLPKCANKAIDSSLGVERCDISNVKKARLLSHLGKKQAVFTISAQKILVLSALGLKPYKNQAAGPSQDSLGHNYAFVEPPASLQRNSSRKQTKTREEKTTCCKTFTCARTTGLGPVNTQHTLPLPPKTLISKHLE